MVDPAALGAQLRATFSNAPFPKGVPAAGHQCSECDGIREAFAEQEPFSLPSSFFERHFDALPMLTPTAFHHFLPGYLAYAVDSPNSLVAMFAWFSVSPAELDDFYRERFGRFSDEERAVVRDVVEFLIERSDEGEIEPLARERARNYWRAA